MARLRLLTLLALAALVLTVALDVASLLSDLAYHHLLRRAIAGNGVSLDALSAGDERQRAFGWAGIAAYVVSGAAFLVWFRAAYVETETLGANLRWSSRWAVGAWFVPLLNLVRPKAIANDVWRGSDPAAPANLNVRGGAGPTPVFLGVWWAAFVISGIAGRVASRKFRSEQGLTDLSSATGWVAASDALDLVAALLALAVVYAVFLRLRSRSRALAGAAESANVARGWFALGAVAILAIVTSVAGAFVVTSGSMTPATTSAPRVAISRLAPLALAPGDSIRIGTTDISCVSTEDRGVVNLSCVPSSSFGPLEGAYAAQISDEAASLADAQTGASTAHRTDPPDATTLAVPKPERDARTSLAHVHQVVPIGGTSVVCTVQQPYGGTLVCGLVRRVSGPVHALELTYVPRSYGIAINQVSAALIRWRADGKSYSTEFKLTEPS